MDKRKSVLANCRRNDKGEIVCDQRVLGPEVDNSKAVSVMQDNTEVLNQPSRSSSFADTDKKVI